MQVSCGRFTWTINQSKPVHQPINISIDHTNQSINQSIIQSINQSIYQSSSYQANQHLKQNPVNHPQAGKQSLYSARIENYSLCRLCFHPIILHSPEQKKVKFDRYLRFKEWGLEEKVGLPDFQKGTKIQKKI